MYSPVDGVDSISSMPDEILHHILSFIPTIFSIRTSALSRRWRHLWCETPSLDFTGRQYYGQTQRTVREINQTLSSYRASKITSFRLHIPLCVPKPQTDNWIEFAVSRNVEKLSLVFDIILTGFMTIYRFPNLFYLSSSLEQLNIEFKMIPAGCTVSWKSLRMLTLNCCYLYKDESIANILSGSPNLETLRLFDCDIRFERLDLSKSYSLRRLVIYNRYEGQEPTEIVAPHIHYFNFRFYRSSCDDACTLVDVSSLAEATLEIDMDSSCLNGDFLETMVLKMLAKLQNVKMLTFNATVLQILSLAELLGVPFPTLKVQTLTIRTRFVRSVIPGIARLLQNSPELKRLTQETEARLYKRGKCWDQHLDNYLDSRGLNPDQCWKSKYGVFPISKGYSRMLYFKDRTLKLMASFMEMVMRNGKTLEKFVVGLEYIDESAKAIWFEELLQMTTTFSNNNNVSIVLKG